MLRFAEMLVDRPLVGPAVLLGLSILFISQAAHVEIDDSVLALVSEGDSAVTSQDEFNRQFGSDNFLAVAVFAPDVYESATLGLIQRLSERISRLEDVESVMSLATALDFRVEDDRIKVVSLLSWGDPETIRGRVISNELYRGHLVSEDSQVAIIFVKISAWNAVTGNAKAMAVLERMRALLREERQSQSQRLELLGMPVINDAVAKATRRDGFLFGIIILALLVGVSLLSFRQILPILFLLLIVSLAIVWTIGLMVMVGKKITPLTVGIPLILFAVVIEYGLFILNEYHNQMAGAKPPRKALISTLERTLTPALFTSVTTAVGFGSLSLSDVPAVREYGQFTAFGSAAGYLLTVVMMPLALSKSSSRPPPFAKQVSMVFERLASINIQWPVGIALAAAVFSLMMLFGVVNLQVNSNILTSFAPDHPLVATYAEVEKSFGGLASMEVIIRSERAGAFRENESMKKVARLQSFIQAQPKISRTFSAVDFLGEFSKVSGSRSWAEAGLGYSSQVSELMPAMGLEQLVDPTYSTARITVLGEIADTETVRRAFSDILQRGNEIFRDGFEIKLVGTNVLVAQTSLYIQDMLIRSLGATLALVGTLLIVLFRSVKLGLLIMIPNVLPVGAAFGLMGWLGVDLDIGTAMLGCIALGLSVDNTIQIIYYYRREVKRDWSADNALRRTFKKIGRPILTNTLILVSGFSAMSLSSFRPLADFGMLAAVALVTALLADLFISPIFLLRMSAGPPAGNRGGGLP